MQEFSSSAADNLREFLTFSEPDFLICEIGVITTVPTS